MLNTLYRICISFDFVMRATYIRLNAHDKEWKKEWASKMIRNGNGRVEKEQEKVSTNIGNGFYYYMLSDGHINVWSFNDVLNINAIMFYVYKSMNNLIRNILCTRISRWTNKYVNSNFRQKISISILVRQN